MTGNSNTKRTWLITGATSGIGEAVARSALDRGENVIAMARSTERLAELAHLGGDRVAAIATDVRDGAQVDAAVAEGLARFGRIDVVANIAGYGLFGAVEEAKDEQVRAIFDTNVFALLNVLRATLPVLRQQGSGHVLQGSSYYGLTAHAGVGMLASTKFAVEGLTDALIEEVAPLGIKVTAIEPGPTATSFLGNLDHVEPLGDYDRTVRAVQQSLSELPAEAFNSAPDVAEAILKIVDAADAPRRLLTGSAAVDAVRQALHARLAEIDSWESVSRAVR